MCRGVGPQHTFNSPHIPTLTFPYISPYPPTPHHTFLHLLSYLFPHPSFLPPHPNTFSYYPHISLHLLKVWRSYHVTKFLWRSYCGEVTMWRSYWQPYCIGLDYTAELGDGSIIHVEQNHFITIIFTITPQRFPMALGTVPPKFLASASLICLHSTRPYRYIKTLELVDLSRI